MWRRRPDSSRRNLKGRGAPVGRPSIAGDHRGPPLQGMVRKKAKPVIVIGGSDPSGGAGIQADLAALQRLGVSAFSVITAVTAQDKKKFLSYECVSSKSFRDQLKALKPYVRGAVIKIGMLGSGRLIASLIPWLKTARPSFVLLDPVLRSTTGQNLLDAKGKRLLKKKLVRLSDLITPNLKEAENLSGIPIRNEKEMEKAGSALRKGGVAAFLIKGGHLRGAPVDFLFHSNKVQRFRGKRLPGKDVHGTGCTLAASIAGYLVLGKSLTEAVKGGRRAVLRKIREARHL